MDITDPLEEIKKVVKETVPPESLVTKVDFEGPEVVLYTKNPRSFATNGEVIKDLARSLRKRIVLRPDSSVLADPEEASEAIKKLVPEEAGITDINFDTVFNEVIIEAKKPGLVIGKSGSTLNEIRSKVGWTPKVMRTPPIKSTIVENIRTIQLKKSDEKKDILRKVGRRIHRPMFSKSQWVRLSILGGFREVGRMAQYIHTPESKVLMDCGINVAANEPENAFPYLNLPEFRLQELDGVVISHAHLDHCGFVPYLFHMGYDGPVYCTPPTRDLMYLLQWDYLDVIEREGRDAPYTRNDIKKVISHTITLEYGEITDISPDVRLTFYNAGHILGSAMSHFHIKEGLYNLAYTGDFKYEKSRLFDAANTRFPRLETLIMESTYGGSKDIQQPRRQAEDEIIKQINDTILRGGKVLIPVFAVGRAQELLVVIEEYRNQGVLEEVPVYLDGMIWEATGIHTTYPSYLNRTLQNQIFHQGRNPFLADIFKKVNGSSERQDVIDGEPCVILATSGMLAGGPAIEYLKAFAEDERNTLIFVGYQAEGSLGRRIQKGWKELPMKENGKTKVLKMNMNIHTVDGFSGHSDRNQLMNYARRLNQKPERIITCHGEESKCTELAYALYKGLRTETKAPQNLEVMRVK
ncbi:MAG: beta-CASP ribonuclease aCPSF1 [Methanobacteriota archaeon]|nr:MAG: beta-CASP ribonuclease aCPSF1 [Euryarchaeota archaeon]